MSGFYDLFVEGVEMMKKGNIEGVRLIWEAFREAVDVACAANGIEEELLHRKVYRLRELYGDFVVKAYTYAFFMYHFGYLEGRFDSEDVRWELENTVYAIEDFIRFVESEFGDR